MPTTTNPLSVLANTGCLLRFAHRPHPDHTVIRAAVRKLRLLGAPPYYTSQNIVEFWNVATRPAASRGGFGLTLSEAELGVRLIYRLFRPLDDSPRVLDEWLRLVVTQGVSRVQVHDARLVAFMNVYQVTKVTKILTLNPGDFTRYGNITAIHPSQV